MELKNIYEIRLVNEIDFEESETYPFRITAETENGQTVVEGKLLVEDIPNTSYTAKFFVSIFDTPNYDDTQSLKSVYRYHNPFDRGVGKWKIRKKISGGEDAHLFVIKSDPPNTRKFDGDDESEGYLSFIEPPDFNNPQDQNMDNIYEVEVTFINLEDGAAEVPVPVTQFQLQVPEGSTSVLELQSRAALPDDDTDGDGVPDITDNSPVIFNPDQADEDGDGVGDVSDDSDHDGVWNPDDECPDTPLGKKVDEFGCEIFYLPSENFRVYKNEKCANQHIITIEFEDLSLTYSINISGAINKSEIFEGRKWLLDNLSGGEYHICITVEGIPASEFERCFRIQLNDPAPLSVYSDSSESSSLDDTNIEFIDFELSGASVYNIRHNGVTTQTSRSSHTLALRKGLNTVQISTNKDCQGVFEKQYFNSESVDYSPNPFDGQFSIYVGGKDQDILVEIYTTEGRLISSDKYKLTESNRNISIDASDFMMGSYLFKVSADTVKKSFVAIKK